MWLYAHDKAMRNPLLQISVGKRLAVSRLALVAGYFWYAGVFSYFGQLGLIAFTGLGVLVVVWLDFRLPVRFSSMGPGHYLRIAIAALNAIVGSSIILSITNTLLAPDWLGIALCTISASLLSVVLLSDVFHNTFNTLK
jgi:hypothetical protein